MPDFTQSALHRLTGLEPFPQPPLLKTRYPVVLMHGFGLFASFRRGGHLHHEAMNLRGHGVIAYAPNVAAYNTIEVRSEMWAKRLAYILEETGTDRLNLIAQSMGGLDARYVITRLGMHASVASLVTVSTPHYGSSVANIVLEQPAKMREWAADILNWMGSNALEDATADFMTSVAELTPEYVRDQFNPQTPDHPSVRYYSYAGAAGKGTDVPINPFLQVLNRLVFTREGVNDGFVAVESAKWSEYLGAVEADHAQQVGISFPGNHRFDSNSFYCRIVKRLASDGF